jgi:two-component system, NtrC family, sensor histidine kinase KinB
MTLSLRQRILLTLAPLLGLLAVLGGSAAVLLHSLGGSSDAILRENYRSVIYMERLKEALERIDSSFSFALAGKEELAKKQFDDQWGKTRPPGPFLENLNLEAVNITVPGEGELVDQLKRLTDDYQSRGEQFFSRKSADPARRGDYFNDEGLLDTFKKIKDTADTILRLNQDTMEQSSRAARRTARNSLIGFGAGLGATALLAAWLARRTLHAILQPIREVTQSARAIGAGNLDQVVPVAHRDELGELAEEFNVMARQLRHYRESGYSRLLRAQRTSQATIDSFPDPVLVVDPESNVEMANPAAQYLFGVVGREPDQKAGVFWQPPEALRGPLLDAIQGQRAYLPEGFDRAIPIAAHGTEHAFLPRILPIRDPFGVTLGAAVLLLDVTRFRLLDQVKSDLVATASHELKTPLTSLRLAVHLLLEETVGPLNSKQTELLIDARDNAERLLAVVNNLLDLARLEQGRENLHIEPIPPTDLLQAAADAIRPRADDKGVEIEVVVPAELPTVVADSSRIEHALGNLLDNALTYTNRGGKITLSAAPAGDQVVLAVADTGQGIPPEYLPRVFERFFRIPGQSLAGGTGLGLAIVREIVAAHGGSVSCESQVGAGSVFRLILPVATV